MKSVLTSKVQSGELIVVDDIKLEEIKTSVVAKMLKDIGAAKKALIVTSDRNETVYKSAKNIAGVETAFVNVLNVYSILKYESMVVTKDAVSKIEEVYA
jgi:large subunit ribosomal protein L4